jgi:hypothetical protein
MPAAAGYTSLTGASRSSSVRFGSVSAKTESVSAPAIARASCIAWGFAALSGLFFAATPAAAEEPLRDDPVEAAGVTKDAAPQQAKRDRKKRRLFGALGARQLGEFGSVEIGGRIFARAALSRHYETITLDNGVLNQRRIDALDFTIPTARVDLRYEAPGRWLSADVEFELAGQPELKDAWVRARGRHFAAQLGQFKTPFSAIELESRFDLPVAERGFLHDVLTKQLQVAGRRPGVTVSAEAGGDLRPSLTLGAFQGSVLIDRQADDLDREPLFEQTMDAQSLFARAQLRAGDFKFGAGYEHRVGTPELFTVAHYPTAGIDVTLDTQSHGRGLRVWVEGMAGSSWFEHSRKPIDTEDATFTAVRAIVAPRIGGEERHRFYFEPYGMLGVMDPDIGVVSDLAVEQALGANVGLYRLARIGIELQHRQVERNFPQSYTLGRNPERLAALIQAAAEF